MIDTATHRKTHEAPGHRAAEQGFLLVGVILMIALVLLVLSVAAPIVAKDLRRERELEAIHRAQQYTRAIRLYYQKFNSYPASVKQLEKTNNVRYLRQHYLDPMTGKDDWRLIGFGQAKTTVKGFFGQPLAGLGGGGGLGSASGLQSPGQSGNTGQSGTSTFGGQSGTSTFGPSGTQSGPQSGAQPVTGGNTTGGATQGGTSDTGSSGSGSSSFGSSSFGSSSFGSSSFGSGSNGSQSATGFSGSGGPFVGIGVPKEGASIIELNEQTDYSKWEFLYDPRIEQLYSKVSLFGGGPASTSSGSLGSASGLSSSGGINGLGTTTGTSGSTGDNGSTGTTGSTGSSGSTGSTGSTGTTNPPTPPPQ